MIMQEYVSSYHAIKSIYRIAVEMGSNILLMMFI